MKQTNAIEKSQRAEKVNTPPNVANPGYFARLKSRLSKSKGEDLNLETWQRLEFRDRAVPCPLRDVANGMKWRI
jgi:hypothetical protein